MLSFAVAIAFLVAIWTYRKSIKRSAGATEKAVELFNEDWETTLMTKAISIKEDRKSKGLEGKTLDELLEDLRNPKKDKQ